jgi:glucose/arabinose dehydrogenase
VGRLSGGPTRSIAVRVPAVAVTAIAWAFVWAFLLARPDVTGAESPEHAALTGQGSSSDWTRDAPGVRRVIRASDLPLPHATPSVERGPRIVPRPPDAWPRVPAGFRAELVATGLENPRNVVVAPNGDLLVAESAAGRIRLLRLDDSGRVIVNEVFASGLHRPFGIAFHPPGPNPTRVYVADTDEVIRFPYRSGDRRVAGKRERVVRLPGGGQLRGGGHWTRDVAFSLDGAKLYVSVGSFTNVAGDASDAHRAEIRECDPDGRACRVYASGVRNAVGLTVHPATGQLWASVNERDELGDDLVPDYITHVTEGGFYGWPWYYLGGNQDPRHRGEHPELKAKVIVPDVLVQSHSASLKLQFCTSARFPAEYRGDGFAALHGSWNRSRRTGYKIVRVLMKDGKATGEYEDFVTGFVVNDRDVWGRPVGVAFAKDGALIFTDDASSSVWRVRHAPRREARGVPR